MIIICQLGVSDTFCHNILYISCTFRIHSFPAWNNSFWTVQFFPYENNHWVQRRMHQIDSLKFKITIYYYLICVCIKYETVIEWNGFLLRNGWNEIERHVVCDKIHVEKVGINDWSYSGRINLIAQTCEQHLRVDFGFDKANKKREGEENLEPCPAIPCEINIIMFCRVPMDAL